MTGRERQVCRVVNADDGITVIVHGTGPLSHAAEEAIRTVARAAAERFAAEACPFLEGLAGAVAVLRRPGESMRDIASVAGVRMADVSAVLQQPWNARARTANALARWARW